MWGYVLRNYRINNIHTCSIHYSILWISAFLEVWAELIMSSMTPLISSDWSRWPPRPLSLALIRTCQQTYLSVQLASSIKRLRTVGEFGNLRPDLQATSQWAVQHAPMPPVTQAINGVVARLIYTSRAMALTQLYQAIIHTEGVFFLFEIIANGGYTIRSHRQPCSSWWER